MLAEALIYLVPLPCYKDAVNTLPVLPEYIYNFVPFKFIVQKKNSEYVFKVTNKSSKIYKQYYANIEYLKFNINL